jgi:hypothetical protein
MRFIRDDIGKAAHDGNSLIPEDIRDACYEKFKDLPGFHIPDICGQMEHTKPYSGAKAPLLESGHERSVI